MNKFVTKGIILSRTDYGEADRIITFLTPDRGKVKALAKGVRKSRSKLAGGLELFSISSISLLIGRGEINTLLSSRLDIHYGSVVEDLDRTNQAYESIRLLNQATADQPEPAYFNLLKQTFAALNEKTIDLNLIEDWFGAQLLKLAGRAPNLNTDKSGQKLKSGYKYDFNPDTMAFEPGRQYNTDQIKFLRLLFSTNPPQTLQKIQNAASFAQQIHPLVHSVLEEYIRI